MHSAPATPAHGHPAGARLYEMALRLNSQISFDSSQVIMKRRYAQQVIAVYPQAINLHPDCQGALLSLVINRGNSLVDKDPKKQTRHGIKHIQEYLESGEVEKIPEALREMKKLWQGDSQNRGLVLRRGAEAVFLRRR